MVCMIVEELVERKQAKIQQIAQAIEAMRKQANDLEIEIRRAEGRFLELQEDLAELASKKRRRNRALS